jgi:hypothetical protein
MNELGYSLCYQMLYYIDLRFHFLLKKANSKLLKLEFNSNTTMWTYILTKALCKLNTKLVYKHFKNQLPSINSKGASLGMVISLKLEDHIIICDLQSFKVQVFNSILQLKAACQQIISLVRH